MEELIQLDPVYSMAETVRLVTKALENIDPRNLSDKDMELVGIIEEKIAGSEDWYERPLDSPAVYEKLMDIAQRKGESEKASSYQAKINRFQANTIEFLGRQQEFFGNSVEALKYYKEALAFTPDHPLAFPGKAKVSKSLDKARNSIPKLREKTGTKPNDPKVWLNLGIAFMHTGDIVNAKESIKKAISLDPNDIKALCKYGTALESEGKFRESLEFFDKALEIKETSTSAKRGKGYALYNLGEMD